MSNDDAHGDVDNDMQNVFMAGQENDGAGSNDDVNNDEATDGDGDELWDLHFRLANAAMRAVSASARQRCNNCIDVIFMAWGIFVVPYMFLESITTCSVDDDDDAYLHGRSADDVNNTSCDDCIVVDEVRNNIDVDGNCEPDDGCSGCFSEDGSTV